MNDREIRTLRENQPGVTEVFIDLHHFAHSDELSEALQSNTFVNKIGLALAYAELESIVSNWTPLLRIIATREILEEVSLRGTKGHYEFERVAPFFLAIQQNPRIHTVNFDRVQLPGDSTVSLLDTATSLRTLGISECDIEAPGSLAIGAALQRNSNIQGLSLHGRYYSKDLIPVVSGLASNASVKELALYYPSLCLNSSLAVKNVLESNKTIQKFELGGVDENVALGTFHPIAQGLIQNTSVTDVKIGWCRFNSQEVVLALNDILESKSNLQSLILDNCCVYEHGREAFRAAIFSCLQQHSFLRTLELFDYYHGLSCYGFDSSEQFARLLTAVESSPLERFSIRKIESRESCLALIASIPKVQVETLEFVTHHDLQDMNGDLLLAVERNARLRTVVVKDWYRGFDTRRGTEWTVYSGRKTFVGRQISNPAVRHFHSNCPAISRIFHVIPVNPVFGFGVALPLRAFSLSRVFGCRSDHWSRRRLSHSCVARTFLVGGFGWTMPKALPSRFLCTFFIRRCHL